jgi:hypothetical protein
MLIVALATKKHFPCGRRLTISGADLCLIGTIIDGQHGSPGLTGHSKGDALRAWEEETSEPGTRAMSVRLRNP